jgi:formylglycine-generating enzyme required for sulfatase activity
MIERSSGQKRRTWTILFVSAVTWIAAGVGWRGFCSLRSALAEESRGRSTKVQRLPGDLVAVLDAMYASLDGLAAGSREAQERQRQAVQQLGLPLEVKTRKTGIRFRLIPAGSSTMGSSPGETSRDNDETQHQVTLSKPFYCGKYEVTQGQWEAVMGSNPSHFKSAGRDAPVETVNWEDCQVFLRKLCQMEGVPGETYRLLTEAQWESACRAGTTTEFCYGNDLDSSMANFDGNFPYGSGPKGEYRQTAVRVGSFQPNGFGLHDMHGNVWEWCRDRYGEYPSGSVTDPLGPASGVLRVFRGGSWVSHAAGCRSADRFWSAPVGHALYLGLRLARTMPSYP